MPDDEVYLPVRDRTCPVCQRSLDGISFGNDVAAPSHLRPCGHYVSISYARNIVSAGIHAAGGPRLSTTGV